MNIMIVNTDSGECGKMLFTERTDIDASIVKDYLEWCGTAAEHDVYEVKDEELQYYCYERWYPIDSVLDMMKEMAERQRTIRTRDK